MSKKPTRWDYITTIIIAILCGCWVVYEYKADPQKIPFEPVIAFITVFFAIWGYSRWKNNKEENNPTTTTQNAEKIYNIETIETAKFGTTIEHSQNVLANTQIDANRDVIIGNQTIIYKDGRKIPRLLTNPPFNADFFIGRERDMQAIENEYQNNNRLLILVNGEGGIGKTTLVSKYWYAHESRYKHLAWLYADAGIGSALLNLAAPLGIAFDTKDDEKTQIRRITEGVNNLEMPCLLVFDNANNDVDLGEYYMILKQLTRCHILLTSRVSKLEDIKVLSIKPLEEADAIGVFKKHYPKYNDSEAPLLLQILQAVGKNTLVIELLAKNLAVSNDFDTTYTLKDLLTDLQEKGLFAIQNEEVSTVYQAETLRKETPDKIIGAMYDLSKLNTAEKYILSNFAVLPPDNIGFALIKDLIIPDDERLFKDSLRSLSRKGWLEYDEAKNDFKISPIVQEITRLKNTARLLADCNTLIKVLIKGLDEENRHTDNYQKATIFAHLGLAVTHNLPIDFNTAILSQNIGNYHKDTGNLSLMMQSYQKMLDIQTALCATKSDNTDFKNALAVSYEKIGITYCLLNNFDKALEFFENETKLFEELYNVCPDKVDFKNGLANAYCWCGIVNNKLGSLDKALIFFEEYNRLEKELDADYTQNIDFKNGLAISYSKLGEVHINLGNFDKALDFFEKRNKISQELYAGCPTNVEFKKGLAISYQFLGSTHTALDNLEKALRFYDKMNKLGKELYDAYKNNVDFKNGLAISYSKLGNTHTALGNLEKALRFYEDALNCHN